MLLPKKLTTYNEDGRKPIKDLYRAYKKLKKSGWILKTVTYSEDIFQDGRIVRLPIIYLTTQKQGNAIWLFAGIHGEEPAGPNALVESLKEIQELGEKVPMVIFPLCNPLGYIKNRRYPHVKAYLKDKVSQSVTDSEHYLLGSRDKPRKKLASCSEARMITKTVIALAKLYPPKISIDLHEDEIIKKNYVYSQGELGAKDPIALRIIEILKSNNLPIAHESFTTFKERIKNGIISNVKDGSIDELLSSKQIFYHGKVIPGPFAKSVIVVETSSASLPIEKRKKVHKDIISSLHDFVNLVKKE